MSEHHPPRSSTRPLPVRVPRPPLRPAQAHPEHIPGEAIAVLQQYGALVSAAARPSAAGVVAAIPEIARVAAVSGWHVMRWSLGATVTGTSYVARRAINGEAAGTILQEAATDLRAAAWRALGLRDMHNDHGMPQQIQAHTASMADLQRRGSELIQQANDVRIVENTHPAFARILSEITPDEARILRFFYLEGPQPTIDVRTHRPFGIGSELVARGLSMIAEHAGCRYVDRIDPYLTNLSRLGLLEFSKEQVSNPTRYQVIEAQPKVTQALKRAGRMPKMVPRSIHLNSFGQQFCQTCLPMNGAPGPRSGHPSTITDRRP